MANAELRNVNGSPAIVVDGKVYPPMTITVLRNGVNADYLKRLGDAGLKIFYLPCVADWIEKDGKTSVSATQGIDDFYKAADYLLKAVPDAKIMVRVYIAPPPEWCEKHPDDVVCFQDGSKYPVIPNSRENTYCGMYSLSSDLWKEEAALSLNAFMEKIDGSPYAESIIGYFLASAGTGEWYNSGPLTDMKNGLYGDCSPAFKKYYSRFLRKKYGSDEVLRKTWGRNDVALDDPPVPPLSERRHISADDEILDALLFHESASRIVGKSINDNPETETNIGVFLNADTAMDCADYFNAWHTATADAIISLAETVRARYGRTKLVGAFYGSYGCTGYYDLGTAEAVLPILDSGAVDFLAAPGNYDNREPGGYVSQREMQDSFRLRNTMFIVEEDARTHHVEDFYKDSMELFSLNDSLHTLKREFGRDICQDMQAWWFDMAGGKGHPWYDEPEILALFQRQQKIAEYAYSIPRAKGNEIACIFDQESLHCVSQLTNAQMLDRYRTSDFNRIGTGMDYYFHDDLANPDMPDYKLYLIVNAFMLTEAERTAMKAKFARNGATAVFLYGAGFILPDAGNGCRMSEKNISDLVGMNVRRFNGTHSPRYKLVPGQEAQLSLADFDRIYGPEDRIVRSNVWLGNSSTAPFMNPGFYVDDPDAVILGRYGLDGKAALAMKKQPGGWTSIYSAPKYLRSELIASFAKAAGCHLFTHTDDCVYANRNFVVIHAASTGKRKLFFPKPCSPYEVYEKRFYGNGVSEIELDMHRGDTLMFSLTGEAF